MFWGKNLSQKIVKASEQGINLNGNEKIRYVVAMSGLGRLFYYRILVCNKRRKAYKKERKCGIIYYDTVLSKKREEYRVKIKL